jgi:hypothetical protein
MFPSLVPVSVRSPGEESIYENRVSALVASLPVNVADPVERLAAITDQMATLKAGSESEAGEALVSLRRYTPFVLASMFVRLAISIPQREIVTVTTNVPGPQFPLYGLGHRLLEVIPYVPIATTLRTGVSIFTYCGQVTFGITGDYATTPDLDVLAAGIEDGIAELLAVVPSPSKAATQLTDSKAPKLVKGSKSKGLKTSNTPTAATKVNADKQARGGQACAIR